METALPLSLLPSLLSCQAVAAIPASPSSVSSQGCSAVSMVSHKRFPFLQPSINLMVEHSNISIKRIFVDSCTWLWLLGSISSLVRGNGSAAAAAVSQTRGRAAADKQRQEGPGAAGRQRDNVLPAGKWVLLSCTLPLRMVSYPLSLGWYNCPDMNYGDVPFMRRFFTDSFYTEEAEVEGLTLNTSERSSSPVQTWVTHCLAVVGTRSGQHCQATVRMRSGQPCL
ncbi:uncharacterized protein LOC120510493 [Passer montanus]|uniref:uncharacterized protein LOC120510493 n=1 Tax=Passer montanus TaxID=9160 RepID=UPI0019617D4E|nr:uncharacterized protein LOC120510493 [Passer montanus]